MAYFGAPADSIAIQSTYAKLRDSLEAAPQPISFGKVQYIDFHTSDIEMRFPSVLKRKSFEHEHELRAVYIAKDGGGIRLISEAAVASIPSGYKIGPVDLNTLIEVVYIAPTAPKWFEALIETVLLKRYGLHKPVVRSDLRSGPVM